ncbi:MAG TPA: hypothetical protein VGQ44_16680, partial [Gemmatimonadaceae bacterium]|nr:hypothetical protein [Gemmatimonadaceae bacterium]
ETRVTAETPVVQPAAAATANGHEERPNGRRRGRRGGRGRGERETRETRETRELTTTAETPIETPVSTPAVAAHDVPPTPAPPVSRPAVREQLELTSAETKESDETSSGSSGQLLTRAEAFDLVRRTVADLVRDDESIRASAVRARARQLLGRDSQSLSDRMFVRILKDAHDEGIIDLRRRGNDFEVARAIESGSVADQVAKAEQAAVAKSQPAATAPGPRLGMGPRGGGGRGGGRQRPGAPPPELLAVGVVDEPAPKAVAAHAEEETNGGPPATRGKRTRGSRAATKTAAKRTATKGGGRPRGKKGASSPDE